MATPNMNLEQAISGVTSLEELVSLFNENMDKIDSHQHLVGEGRSIPLSALDGESDLSMGSNNILQALAASFLSGNVDSLLNASIYFKNNDLFVRKGDGVVIQVTAGRRLSNQVSPVTETSTILYGYSAVQTALSDDEVSAQNAASAASSIESNRSSKTGNSVRTGCFVSFRAPVSTGYYWPWLAILQTEAVGTVLMLDPESGQRDNQWVSAGTLTVSGTAYNLMVRKLPLEQNQNLNIIVRSYL